LYSQFPFTAAACIQTFSWNGDSLGFVSIRYDDPSANVVEEFISAAESGNFKKLDSLANVQKFDSLGTLAVLYPHRYVNGDMVANAIKRGHVAAIELFKVGKIGEAANRMALMFDITVKLYTHTVEELEDDLKPPVRWLEVWKWLKAEPKDYIYALNDYGFFLQEAENHQTAVPIFEAVIKEDSTRLVAYLNLADSFWALARKVEAKRFYQVYQRLMNKAGKLDKIPSRVGERLKS
jgi:tetratricopeptide (TPR) repeat protein